MFDFLIKKTTVQIGRYLTLIVPVPVGLIFISLPILGTYFIGHEFLLGSVVDGIILLPGGIIFSFLFLLFGSALIFWFIRDRLGGKCTKETFRNWGVGFYLVIIILIISLISRLASKLIGIDILYEVIWKNL